MSSHLSPERMAELILDQPLAAIYAINAVDCLHLNLIELDPLRAYIKEISSKLLTLSKYADIETALLAAFNTWKEDNKNYDKREPIPLETLNSDKLVTVMAFASFYYNYSNILASALKSRSTGVTSKVAALKSSALSLKKKVTGLSEDEVDEWVRCLIKFKSLKSDFQLVSEYSRVVWCALDNKSKPLKADKLRAKLGLIHLPYDNSPASKTLIRLEYDKSELYTASKLKRPCLFDCPGSRFRALSHSEMESTCDKPKKYGMTVNITDPKYSDGEKEWAFVMKESLSLKHWNIKKVIGRLDDEDSLVFDHKEFANHLISNKPVNTILCKYRQDNDGIKKAITNLLDN